MLLVAVTVQGQLPGAAVVAVSCTFAVTNVETLTFAAPLFVATQCASFFNHPVQAVRIAELANTTDPLSLLSFSKIAFETTDVVSLTTAAAGSVQQGGTFLPDTVPHIPSVAVIPRPGIAGVGVVGG